MNPAEIHQQVLAAHERIRAHVVHTPLDRSVFLQPRSVKWIEFQGGHNIAPALVYDAAFAWLSAIR